jgi:hypothetical protein
VLLCLFEPGTHRTVLLFVPAAGSADLRVWVQYLSTRFADKQLRLLYAMRACCLQVLMLAGHSFSGTLPCSWARLLQLRVLDLSMLGVSKGGLTGTLPGSFAAMKLLQVGVSMCKCPCSRSGHHAV